MNLSKFLKSFGSWYYNNTGRFLIVKRPSKYSTLKYIEGIEASHIVYKWCGITYKTRKL